MKFVVGSKFKVALRVEPLTASQRLAQFGVRRSSGSEGLYFICHVTSIKSHINVSCKFMDCSFLRCTIILTSLSAIGFLTFKRKKGSDKNMNLVFSIDIILQRLCLFFVSSVHYSCFETTPLKVTFYRKIVLQDH